MYACMYVCMYVCMNTCMYASKYVSQLATRAPSAPNMHHVGHRAPWNAQDARNTWFLQQT